MTTAKDVRALRIDTAIKPNSCLRAVLYLSMIGVMLFLAWFAQLVLWQYIFVLTISAGVGIYLVFTKPILLHISQPPVDRQVDKDWQLLMRTSRADELWLAELKSINSYSWLISCNVMTVEPFRRQITVVIYRDQVSKDQWRQLMILANSADLKSM